MGERIEDGGPAFPFDEKGDQGAHWCSHPGMSKREYFAGLAMQGLLAGGSPLNRAADCEHLSASASLTFADALIAALAATSKGSA